MNHPRPDRMALAPLLAALAPVGWTVFAEWKATAPVRAWTLANQGQQQRRPLIVSGDLYPLIREAERKGLIETRTGPSRCWEIRKTEGRAKAAQKNGTNVGA